MNECEKCISYEHDAAVTLLFFLSLTGKEKRVGGFDLVWNDGPVYSEDVDPEIFGCSCLKANTYLGKGVAYLESTSFCYKVQ